MGGTVKVDEIKEINFNETGDIIDTLSGISLKDTPEERVRQRDLLGFFRQTMAIQRQILQERFRFSKVQKFYYRLMKLKFVQILLFTRIKKHV